ncbi:MAG: RadC family protein [Clostridia bacterium]
MAEGHRQRMRERFYNEGIDSFEPHEALEMILYFTIPRKDTNALAHSLIQRFGSFHGVLDANREDLVKFGLTENTVALLKMFPSFLNYYTQSHATGIPYIPDTTVAGEYAIKKVGNRTTEIFGIICLDAQRKLINFEIVEEGTVDKTNVSVRKIAECVLRNNASKVILVHNHPGGTLSPSQADIALTKRIYGMLTTIEVGLLDHIIVANGKSYSMLDHGLID